MTIHFPFRGVAVASRRSVDTVATTLRHYGTIVIFSSTSAVPRSDYHEACCLSRNA